MKFSDIKRHLRPYVMVANRRTTINHAFAAAIAPCDEYDGQNVKEAIKALEQDPNSSLTCVYCGEPAETWDHVFATVQKSVFSGFGHRLGNLLPCCKPCNSKKGNKLWKDHIKSVQMGDEVRIRREKIIEGYLAKNVVRDESVKTDPDYEELMKIRDQVLDSMKKADTIAAEIRRKW